MIIGRIDVLLSRKRAHCNSFVCLPSVHPMLCQQHEIGCTDDNQTIMLFSVELNDNWTVGFDSISSLCRPGNYSARAPPLPLPPPRRCHAAAMRGACAVKCVKAEWRRRHAQVKSKKGKARRSSDA